MKHGDKTVGVVEGTCLYEGHVGLTGNCRINGRAAGATEVATDGTAGIRIAVFVKRQISREFDISLLKGRKG